jgi:DNA-binding sugar fermentation-stimulating protein
VHLDRSLPPGAAIGRGFHQQRADTTSFALHQTADPVFATTLREAVQAGVEARVAYTCHVS